MATIVVGNRKGFGRDPYEPHNILLTSIGAALLWVGWTGFSAGASLTGALMQPAFMKGITLISAVYLIANAQAAQAVLNTQIAASASALSWVGTEALLRKPPSALGLISGSIAGLVAITPGCGWVDQTGAFFIGLLAGPWCYGGAQLKHYFGYDDALDAFGVHATGGLLGGILTGFFANPTFFGPFIPGGAPRPINPESRYYPGVFYAIGEKDQQAQLATQAYAFSCTILYSSVASLLLLKAVDLTLGLRAPDEDLMMNIDASMHDETPTLYEKDLDSTVTEH